MRGAAGCGNHERHLSRVQAILEPGLLGESVHVGGGTMLRMQKEPDQVPCQRAAIGRMLLKK